MDPLVLTKLLSPAGYELLESLPPYDAKESLARSTSLRGQGHDPDLVAAVLSQSQLRSLAAAKFGEFASDMLFTRDGLEQATRLPVAARHAGRFTEAGAARIADLGCGIGGDAIAFAGLGASVDAVEADEVTAAIATFNLRHLPSASVSHGLAEDFPLGEADAVWLDPARRETGRSGRGGQAKRIFDPEAFSPPLSWVTEAARKVRMLGAKLGPALPHDQIPDRCQAQWVSHHGDVVEVVLWFGDAIVGDARRTALVLGSVGAYEIADDGANEPADVAPVGTYLYEPDGAVIRAGLVAPLARQLGGTLIDRTIAYISSETAMSHPAARGWKVDAVLPMTIPAVRSHLAKAGVGRAEIKKRGADIVPETVRKQLKLRGTESATLFYTRIDGRHQVIVAHDLEEK